MHLMLNKKKKKKENNIPCILFLKFLPTRKVDSSFTLQKFKIKIKVENSPALHFRLIFR